MHTGVSRSVMKSNRTSLRWCPKPAHVLHTRDHISTSVCVNKNSSNQHGSSMFPGPHGDVAAVDSAGMCVCKYVCVCVWERESNRVIPGCKEGASEVRGLTEGTT